MPWNLAADRHTVVEPAGGSGAQCLRTLICSSSAGCRRPGHGCICAARAVEYDVCTGFFVAEVESLRRHYPLHADLPPCAAGYRQVLDVLEQRSPREEMFDRALFATRQLAKRQLTWLRSFPWRRVACDAPDALARLRHCWRTGWATPTSG